MSALADRRATFARNVWRELRDAASPRTVVELAAAVRAPRTTSVQRLVRHWRHAGLVDATPSIPMRVTLTDPHPTPPRIRITGALDRKPSVRQRIWTAIRVLKRFDVPTLTMAAEAKRGSVTAFVNELLRAGYVVSLSTGVAIRGTWSVYQLVRRSGRAAPKVQVGGGAGLPTRTLVDPNDGSRHDISPGAVSKRPFAAPDVGGEG